MIGSRSLLSKIFFWAALSVVWLAGLWAYLTTVVWAPAETWSLVYGERTFEIMAPDYVGLLLVLPLLAIVARYTLSDFPLYQRVLNAALRALVLAGLTLALMQPVVTSFDSKIATIIVVDTSASFPDEALEQARQRINTYVKAATDDDQVRVIGFADRPYQIDPGADGTYAELPRPARQANAEPAEDGGEADKGDQDSANLQELSDDPTLQTDISAALRMAYGLFPDDHLKRLVVISDGNQTRGDVLAEANRAADFGIRLYAATLDYEQPAEVLIEAVDVPENIELGAPFYLVARVFSTYATTARLTLWQNEYRDGEQEVELQRGVTEIRFQTEVYEPGFRQFRLQMSVNGPDGYAANNSFMYSAHIRGKARVLYVEGEMRSRHHLERALRNENFDVETRSPAGLPRTEEELDRFDLVLLSDVHSRHVSDAQQDLLTRYVRDLGGGLIMAGGQDSFGPGKWEDSAVERLMPVSFEGERQRETPSLALLMVIDRSGSMSGDRIALAKDAARAAVEVLQPGDQVGVLAFDNDIDPIVRLQPAANRSRILSAINRLQVRGGTDIELALNEAYEQLAFASARVKHIILLTDGMSEPGTIFTRIMPAMRIENITVTTVAVGDGAETSMLRRIAERGSGRYHFTNNPYNVPQIFTQETRTVARSALAEEPIRAQVAGRAQLLEGIAWNAAPYLLGYVTTRPKPQSEVLLTVEGGDPLLARWRVGLGKTAAFTSDLKNRWGAEWVRWPGYAQLWAQLIRDTMRTDDRDRLPMRVVLDGERARVMVDAIGEDDRFINDLDSVLRVTDPEGNDSQVTLHQRAPGRYEASFPLPQFGAYQLAAQHDRAGDTFAVSQASLAYPYPREMTYLEPNEALIAQIVAMGKGEMDPSPEAIFDADGEEVRYRRQLWPWALLVALAIMVLDLALRRIRLSGQTELSWLALTRSK
ncbi:VWA domain-containing protein [Lujinxingia sediminis]|uniref:VWA domain-containing protein n=1 Tax=Lujinxingia sediminis TaxID=2480984 RepID=A0ABY0CT96_9DELT|nr:VWA domain-containing protein [Lujinxingia sediminis]RVU44051.1 VWA domain-containing protein [Lujinxingia sediminis]